MGQTVVGSVKSLACNPTADRRFSQRPISDCSATDVRRFPTNPDEIPTLCSIRRITVPCDRHATDSLLFSDAPTTRPTISRLRETPLLSSSDSCLLSIRRPTFLVVASRSHYLSAPSLSMSIVHESTGA